MTLLTELEDILKMMEERGIDDELYNGDIITQKDFIEEPLDVKTIDVETNDVYFISGVLVHNK